MTTPTWLPLNVPEHVDLKAKEIAEGLLRYEGEEVKRLGIAFAAGWAYATTIKTENDKT